MTKLPKTAVVIFTLLFVITLSSTAHAAVYTAPAITNIAVATGGEVYIRFAGLPNNPSPCGGNNNGWVMIPSTASDVMKSLALSIYFSGKPVRIETSGCNGAYELVTGLYSPDSG
jgi:hypothetical protein